MSLSKRRRGRHNISRVDKTGGHNGRKMKPVKLPKTLRITMTEASANQVTNATIMNVTKIRVKNNTTVMVSDLPSRHKLHGQIRNKRNIRDMKMVITKYALSSNRKRGTISGMNSAMTIRRTQSRKMSRMRSHMKGSAIIQIPRSSTWRRSGRWSQSRRLRSSSRTHKCRGLSHRTNNS
jgi:hypothetical protein